MVRRQALCLALLLALVALALNRSSVRSLQHLRYADQARLATAAHSTAAGSAGNAQLLQPPQAPAFLFGIPHNQTARCTITSFAGPELATRCAPDEQGRGTAAGCAGSIAVHDAYEAATIAQLLAGQPVEALRCGFMDASSAAWMADMQHRFERCQMVIFTTTLSDSQPPVTAGTVEPQPGECYVAFVDTPVAAKLQAQAAASTPAAAAVNSSAHGGSASASLERSGRWEVVLLDPALLAPTTARSAHQLRMLALRLFPSAAASMYIDGKAQGGLLKPDPFKLLRLLLEHSPPAVMAGLRHPVKGRDVYTETLAVLSHLNVRRDRAKAGTANPLHLASIKGQDMLDIFRQYLFYHGVGYPVHHTGLVENTVMVWNHNHPCAIALACLWYNKLTWYSQRTQLSHLYVLQMLGLTDQVLLLAPLAEQTNYSWPDPAAARLEPAGLPRWGQLRRDEYWRRRRHV